MFHFRQIGQAILLYTNENHDQYPDTFGTLLLNEDISSDIFICPSTTDTTAQGPMTQAIVNELARGGHESYVYLGKGMTVATTPANAVIVYEPLSNHQTGMNVLLADGHVKFVDADVGTRLIAKASVGVFPVTMPSQ